MVSVYRGRIPAIMFSLSASVLALVGSIQAQQAPEAQYVPVASPVASQRVWPSDALDVQWLLADSHASLRLADADRLDRLPEPSSPDLRGLTSTPWVTPPHVDPSVDNQALPQVNDKLVPFPVLRVEWLILLCAGLFRLGSRVLRVKPV